MPAYLKIFGIALLGVLIMAAALLYDLMFAGLPYQDPPPDLLETWQAHKAVASMIMAAGVFVLVSGIAAIPLLWYRLRKSQRG